MVLQPVHFYCGTYSFRGLVETHLVPLHSLQGGEGFSVPGLVPSNEKVNSESVVDIKTGDSGVVIGYQVDEFTHTWSVEQFVTHSHIYPGFMDKVSSVTHFPLEPGCENYSFLDQAVATLNRAWIPSSLIPSRHKNWTHLWCSLMSLHLQSHQGFSMWLVLFLILLNCSLLLALGLINYGARLGLFLHLCLWLPR